MRIRRYIAWALSLLLALSVPALGESYASLGGNPFPEAFQTESAVLSMDTAWFVLTNFIRQDAESTAAAFGGLGFEILAQEHYGKDLSDHSHTSAYTLARGVLNVRGSERSVLAVSIRGTGDGEWYSNFDPAGETKGECQWAENFMAAAKDIYGGIAPYIESTERPVVVACGYSRGAACANLLGVLLDDTVGPEDVYVYTFATPNTSRGERPGYDNIFNFVNMNDPVTRMPPAAWGFARPGTDIEMREPGYVNADMHAMFISLLGLCPDIDSYYSVRHSLTGPGLSDDGATVYDLFQTVAGVFTSAYGGQESPEQDTLRRLAEADNDFSEFFSVFGGMLRSASEGRTDGSLFGQHMPDVYIRLMSGLSRE